MPEKQSVIFNAKEKSWSTPSYPYKDFINQSLGEVFLKSMRTPGRAERVLEYYYDTDDEKTGKEIYHESIAVAKSLQRLGVQKDDVVVIYSMNNQQTTSLIFGSYMIGAIVNFYETKLEKEHIDYTLGLMEPKVIFYEERWKNDLFDSLKRSPLPSAKHIFSIDASTKPNVTSEMLQAVSQQEINSFQSVKIDDPKKEVASYVFTSGSTGIPKIVVLTHALMLHGCSTWFDHTNTTTLEGQNAVVFSFSPLRWISQVQMMFHSLFFGAKRVCASGFPEGAYGRELIRKGKITHFFTPPTIFDDILCSINENDVHALDSLRTVQLGGEPPSQAVMEMTRKLARNCMVFRCYGMTEVSGCITNDEHINGGQLVSGTQLQILDDNMQPVGPNVRGQLYVKTPAPFKPYFKVDSSKDYLPDGFLLNGDYGFMDEKNNLHIEARYKDLLKSGNVILIPNNIEVALNELPEVAMSRLVGFKKSSNDKDDIGTLFVLLNADVKATHDSLRGKIRGVLKNFLSEEENEKISFIHFVSEMPVTSCGKVDRAALRRKAGQM